MNALAAVASQPNMPVLLQVNATAVRLADEGVPVRAIARVLKIPSSDIYDMLNEAILEGALVSLPKDDWPHGSSRASRITFAGTPLEDEEAFKFACVRAFKVTNLEIAVLEVLLKRAQATKEQLHHTIKNTRPGEDREEIDPKIVDVVICHIRKKLKPAGVAIETVWGIGYLISVPDRDKALAALTLAVKEMNPNG